MKLFYHFLVLVAASLILIACANMFASTPEKKLNRPAERSGINLDKDSLLNSGTNTRAVFPDFHYYNILSNYADGSNKAGYKMRPVNNLFAATNYLSLSRIQR